MTGFTAVVIGEICWGLVVGWGMLRLRRWVADARVEIILALLTPFAAFWVPESVGGSGVLATVVGRPLRQLERPAFHFSHHPPPGIFCVGFGGLSD